MSPTVGYAISTAYGAVSADQRAAMSHLAGEGQSENGHFGFDR
jgi:Transposase DDE domain group 1